MTMVLVSVAAGVTGFALGSVIAFRLGKEDGYNEGVEDAVRYGGVR